MRKSQKREYELDRKWDFDEGDTPARKRVVKRRARRRFRSMKKPNLRLELFNIKITEELNNLEGE